MGTKYQYGVYLSPQRGGRLWLLYKPEKKRDERRAWTYALLKGQKCTNTKINALHRLMGQPRPYMEHTFDDGYWADKMLGDCEYLGEL